MFDNFRVMQNLDFIAINEQDGTYTVVKNRVGDYGMVSKRYVEDILQNIVDEKSALTNILIVDRERVV